MKPNASRLFAALPALLLSFACAAQTVPQKLSSIRLNFGIHNVNAEVAQTPDQRGIGLMFRQAMPPNDGMLFVFDEPGTQCFWMKNTFIPLSTAFIADDGSIVNIADMQPKALDSHCSDKPVRYVLEMNQGWFAKRGVKPGAKLQGGPFGR
jgi:uncharacterized membrane protein (UPF0127 family)